MVHSQLYRCFKLKPSRLRYGFQLFFGLGIAILLFKLLSLSMWIIAVLLLLISAYLLHRQASIEQLEQLDADLWSVKISQNAQIQNVRIEQIVDHLFYIVIYFEDIKHLNKRSNFIIWQDQCDSKSWKMLKIQAKLA